MRQPNNRERFESAKIIRSELGDCLMLFHWGPFWTWKCWRKLTKTVHDTLKELKLSFIIWIIFSKAYSREMILYILMKWSFTFSWNDPLHSHEIILYILMRWSFTFSWDDPLHFALKWYFYPIFFRKNRNPPSVSQKQFRIFCCFDVFKEHRT